MGTLSPVFISEIRECFQVDNKRLDTIRSLVIILAFPLTLGLLKDVASKNKDIERDIGNVVERIDNLKQDAKSDKLYYSSLVKAKNETIDTLERSYFEKRILSFKIYFLNNEDFVKKIHLCKPNVNCTEYETEQFNNIESIYDQREHSLWVTKAKVAYLLRFTTSEVLKKTNEVSGRNLDWEKIIGALLDRMTSREEFLVVSKTALDSFRSLVPDFKRISPVPSKDNPATVFDFDEAIAYWNNNKNLILSRLKAVP